MPLQANQVLRDTLDDIMEVYDVVLNCLKGVLAQGANLVAVSHCADCGWDI